MNAVYFMGTSKGESKKTGKSFWIVNVLWLNSFNNYEVKPLFVTADIYDAVCRMDLPRGSAVDIAVNLDGQLVELSPSKKIKPLNLGELAT